MQYTAIVFNQSQNKLSTCTATADRFLCASAEEGDVLSERGC